MKYRPATLDFMDGTAPQGKRLLNGKNYFFKQLPLRLYTLYEITL